MRDATIHYALHTTLAFPPSLLTQREKERQRKGEKREGSNVDGDQERVVIIVIGQVSKWKGNDY